MKINSKTFLFLLLPLCLMVTAAKVIQTSSPVLTIKTEMPSFEVDNLGNIYLIGEHEIIKYKPNGEKFATYSNKSLGEISSVDVSNPLKILLFYRNNSSIHFLDNMHGKSFSEINLTDILPGQMNLAATSYNNGIWIYNPIQFQLIRYDENMSKTVDVYNLHQIIGEKIKPIQMIEKDNLLYINDPESGFFIFDIYGTFYKKIPLKNVQSFSVSHKVLNLFNGTKLIRYSTGTFESDTLPLPAQTLKAAINSGNMYVLDGKTLGIYNLTKPEK